MNELEQKNLLQTEAQFSDELSAEDLEVVNGGCRHNPLQIRRDGGVINHWLKTDCGPNIARHIPWLR